MSDGISGDRRQRLASPRRPMVLAVMALAVLLTACGSASSSSAAAVSAQYSKAVAYSQCIRSHGVPAFPDPNSDGVLPASQGGARFGVSDTVLKAAEQSCRSLLPSGTSGAQPNGNQQQITSQLLTFARCMRSHGVPNYPDPTASNGSVSFNLNGIDVNSPQYLSANKSCQSLDRK